MSLINLNWRELTAADVSLEPLLDLLTKATEPMSLSILALTFAKMHFRGNGPTGLKPVPYNPKLIYSVGISLQLPNGQVARGARISPDHNPIQGQFQILPFIETHFPRLVAGLVPTTPESAYSPNPNETEVEEQAYELRRTMPTPTRVALLLRCFRRISDWQTLPMSGGWPKNCLIQLLTMISAWCGWDYYVSKAVRLMALHDFSLISAIA